MAGSRRWRPARRIVGDDAAVIDDDEPVAETLGLFHVVRGVESVLPRRFERLEVVEDGVAALRVDADRRLVEQQDVADRAGARRRGSGAASCRRCNAPTLSVARSASPTSSSAASMAMPRCCPCETVEGAEEGEIVARGKLVVEREILRDEPDPVLDGIGIAAQGPALDQDLAGIRRKQSGDHGHRGRLPGAIGTKQAYGLARVGMERDAVDGGNAPVALAQLLDFKHRSRECNTGKYAGQWILFQRGEWFRE